LTNHVVHCDVVKCETLECNNQITLHGWNNEKRFCPECVRKRELERYKKAYYIRKEKLAHWKYYDKKRRTIQHENCMMCGLPLIDREKIKRRPKFCSVKCNQRFHWLTHKPANKPKKCMICSRVFIGIKNQKYCSVFCYAQSLTAYWKNRRNQQKLIKVVAR